MKYPKKLSSGRYIDLGNFKCSDIDLFDIERSLKSLTRFTGHYSRYRPLTVAEHSFLVLAIAKDFWPDNLRLQKAAFIHDFEEAYVGDIISPIKQMLKGQLKEITEPIEAALEVTFLGGTLSILEKRAVKLCDMSALNLERKVMWEDQDHNKLWPTGYVDHWSINDKISMYLKSQYACQYTPFYKVLRKK